MTATTVRDAAELASAIIEGATEIEVEGVITGSPMITLPPGTTLRGGGVGHEFSLDADGAMSLTQTC